MTFQRIITILFYMLILLRGCEVAYGDAGNTAPDADPAGDVADVGMAAIGNGLDAAMDAAGDAAGDAADGLGVGQDDDDD